MLLQRDLDLPGGVVFDALLAEVALRERVDRIGGPLEPASGWSSCDRGLVKLQIAIATP